MSTHSRAYTLVPFRITIWTLKFGVQNLDSKYAPILAHIQFAVLTILGKDCQKEHCQKRENPGIDLPVRWKFAWKGADSAFTVKLLLELS